MSEYLFLTVKENPEMLQLVQNIQIAPQFLLDNKTAGIKGMVEEKHLLLPIYGMKQSLMFPYYFTFDWILGRGSIKKKHLFIHILWIRGVGRCG